MFLHTPTPEQAAILSAAQTTQASILIEADAGAAKSTTLEMIAQTLPPQPFLALAFNVKIKKALEARLPSHAKVMTLNGLGHSAWLRTIRGKTVTLDDKKLGRILTAVAKSMSITITDDLWLNIRDTVSGAMMSGLIPASYPQKGLIPDTNESWSSIWPVGPIPEDLIPLCRAILEASIDEGFRGTISYDDQIYLPTMFGGVFPRYDLVLVDEGQDLSQLNILQIKKTGPKRLIVAGDRKQSIYAFRGADSAAMDRIKGLSKDWIELPLHQTFRCPRAVVARQQRHAPGYTAAESCSDGEILSWLPPPNCSEEEHSKPTWDLEMLRPYFSSGIFILCRNNGPLMSIAMKMIRARIGPTMLGRDIGKGLIALSKKILPSDDTDPAQCRRQIATYYEAEALKLRLAEQDSKISGLEDRTESLLAVLDFSTSAGDLRRNITEIFANENSKIVLGSIHRAKGLESPCVLHLDPWRIPSRYAKGAAHRGDMSQLRQEENLQYVCETRTSHTLILANLKNLDSQS